MGRRSAIGSRVLVGFVLAATILVAVPQTAAASPSWRIQRCLNSLNAARSDQALTQAQKNYLASLCDGDIAAEAVAEPQGALAPLIFPDHYYMMSDPTKAADRFGHSLHCMDTSADRFGLVDIPAKPTGIDLTKPGGTAPLNYPGEFLLAEVGDRVRLFNRVVFWQTRPDNEPVLIKNQILFPGNSNTTVARVYNAPQHVPMSIWTEIDASILQAWPADMNTPLYPTIIPGRIMNLRTWYGDTHCHDKRGEIRIPNLVLDYAIAHGFANGRGSLSQPTRIRLQSSGDPYVGSNWSLLTTGVAVQNTQTTNGYKWFHAGDVHDQSSGDVTSPTVSVSHGAGTTFSGPNVTLSGSATDNVGVESVAVTIQDPTGDFLQSNGSFAPGYAERVAGLGSPGATSTTWSVDVTLPDDPYDFAVYARDAAGNQGSRLNADFVVGEGRDNTRPAAPLLDHSPFADFAGPGVTLTGTATDNVGVTSVRIKIKNRTTGLWLQGDGSFAAPPTWHQAAVNNAGEPSVTWSIEVALPSGSFNPVSEAFDAAGNSRTQTVWTPFDVTVAAGDTTPPSVSTAHSSGSTFDGPNVTLVGDAIDDVGVAGIGVTIVNSAGDFLQPDGTFAAATAELTTTLGTPGGTSTTWQITVLLPDDSYYLRIYARDTAGNETTETNADFSVASVVDGTGPAAPLLDHEPMADFTGPDVTLTGTASDNVGVTSVRIKIKNRNTGLWLQADGSFAAAQTWHAATVDNPGAASITWSIDVTLPSGSFNPVAQAFDAAGNSRTQTVWLPFDVI
jgi:hypothetical protein